MVFLEVLFPFDCAQCYGFLKGCLKAVLRALVPPGTTAAFPALDSLIFVAVETTFLSVKIGDFELLT